jgi:hypothetical protein
MPVLGRDNLIVDGVLICVGRFVNLSPQQCCGIGASNLKISVGQHVWIPCEVKPGAFSDERMVRVNSPAVNSAIGSWIGFVPTARLREPIELGSTWVTAIVVNVLNDRFIAQLVGDPLANAVFEDSISRAQPIDSFES